MHDGTRADKTYSGNNLRRDAGVVPVVSAAS